MTRTILAVALLSILCACGGGEDYPAECDRSTFVGPTAPAPEGFTGPTNNQPPEKCPA